MVKRSGAVEPFSRDKVVSGVRKACKGRPVTEDQLARLGQLVEDSLRASGLPEVPADEVGVAILGPLRDLDQVAYLRFASVYRQFRSVDDFESEIALLRMENEPAGLDPLIPDLAADAKVDSFTPHRLTPRRRATTAAATDRPDGHPSLRGWERVAGEGSAHSAPVPTRSSTVAAPSSPPDDRRRRRGGA